MPIKLKLFYLLLTIGYIILKTAIITVFGISDFLQESALKLQIRILTYKTPPIPDSELRMASDYHPCFEKLLMFGCKHD